MVQHFVFDIFHFDGKFFETLKNLFLRPGSISKEFVEGKRTKYLDPIRMYLFTSGLFFIIFFAAQNSAFKINDSYLNKSKRLDIASEIKNEVSKRPNDSFLISTFNKLLDTSYLVELDTLPVKKITDSSIRYKGRYFRPRFIVNENNKSSVKFKGQSWISRKLNSHFAHFNEEYSDSPGEWIKQLLENFVHKLPYLLFLSLPFFAGILKLIYVRRKNFYYTDHAVFTFHHYILSFILMMVAFLLMYLKNKTGFHIWDILSYLIMVSWLVYLYLEMKSFYRQGAIKTIVKLFILSFLMILVLIVLFTLFLLFSFLQI